MPWPLEILGESGIWVVGILCGLGVWLGIALYGVFEDEKERRDVLIGGLLAGFLVVMLRILDVFR